MINISGAPPNGLAGGPPAPPYYDNYSGPANPACFLTLNDQSDWAGQTFTTTFRYNLEYVELWLKKGPGSDVGNVEVALFTVDGEGEPLLRLNWGYILNADISEDYSWVSCTWDYKITAPLLDAATKYAIVIHGDDIDVDNTLLWACGGDGSDYPNGDQLWSFNSGGTWSVDTTRDQLFRCYPTPYLDNYSGSQTPFIIFLMNGQNIWAGQTFTAMKSYRLARIDWWGKKNVGDFVGDITLALYGVDENGHPDIVGGAKASGTIPDADVPDDYAWIRCDFSACNLTVDTKYAIVIHGFSLNPGNVIFWCKDNWLTVDDYPGGNMETSTNSGGTWDADTDFDFLFRCYSV